MKGQKFQDIVDSERYSTRPQASNHPAERFPTYLYVPPQLQSVAVTRLTFPSCLIALTTTPPCHDHSAKKKPTVAFATPISSVNHAEVAHFSRLSALTGRTWVAGLHSSTR